MTGLLAGARGVVIGVSSANSLGYAIARHLHAQGAEVALTCRPPRIDQVWPLAAELGGRALAVDVTDDASLAAAFAALGPAPLDFVVHSVVDIPEGVLARPMVELSRAEFEHVMTVSAWSLIAVCRHARPLLAKSQAPRVVTLTSSCSHRSTPNYHVAGIAKAALESAVVYLAMQLGRESILVNAISSSLIATDGAIRAIGAGHATSTRAVQARRSATGVAVGLDDVARSVGFLCSPMASNLTGEILTVDGGFSRTYL
ncbi:MAG TPA: SDR family oxidoreductase [Kofleriaceae bacterium]